MIETAASNPKPRIKVILSIEFEAINFVWKFRNDLRHITLKNNLIEARL